MNSTFSNFCKFLVTIFFVIIIIYIGFFTDIPMQTRNLLEKTIEEINNDYEEYSENFVINELGIRMNTYYYNYLSDGQKKIYTAIANAVKNFNEEFVVREYLADNKENFAKDVNIAIEAFINDHPEVFYLDSQYTSYIVSGFNGNYGYIKLNYTESTTEAIEEKIELMKLAIDEYIKDTDGLSEYEKEILIHDRLSYDIEYLDGEELPRKSHTIEGTLIEKIGVCDSFTKTLQILYDRVGIDSIIVVGQLNEKPHAWNLVKIEDEWYHVDITSSHSIYTNTGIVNHAYFNLNTQGITKFSSIENSDIIPYTDATKYNYYKYNNLEISQYDDLETRLAQICDKFKDKNYIEFYFDGYFDNNVTNILSILKNIDASFVKNSKGYYYNIENDIIILKN